MATILTPSHLLIPEQDVARLVVENVVVDRSLARTVSHVKLNPRRNLDFAKAIQISKEMHFQGIYSLETGGPDPYADQQRVLDALLQNL